PTWSRGRGCRADSGASSYRRLRERRASGRAPPCRGALRSTHRSRTAESRASRWTRRVRRAPRPAGRRSGRSPRCVRSPVLDLQSEGRPPFLHGAVERLLVFLRDTFLERARETVAHVGEGLGRRLDDVGVVAVRLLRVVAVGTVVALLHLPHLGEQAL